MTDPLTVTCTVTDDVLLAIGRVSIVLTSAEARTLVEQLAEVLVNDDLYLDPDGKWVLHENAKADR